MIQQQYYIQVIDNTGTVTYANTAKGFTLEEAIRKVAAEIENKMGLRYPLTFVDGNRHVPSTLTQILNL